MNDQYMQVHSCDIKKPNCPRRIPMSLLNEDQAYSNHGQSLKKLNERGGISVSEALLIIQRKPLIFIGKEENVEENIKQLNAFIADHLNKQ